MFLSSEPKWTFQIEVIYEVLQISRRGETVSPILLPVMCWTALMSLGEIAEFLKGTWRYRRNNRFVQSLARVSHSCNRVHASARWSVWLQTGLGWKTFVIQLRKVGNVLKLKRKITWRKDTETLFENVIPSYLEVFSFFVYPPAAVTSALWQLRKRPIDNLDALKGCPVIESQTRPQWTSAVRKNTGCSEEAEERCRCPTCRKSLVILMHFY